MYSLYAGVCNLHTLIHIIYIAEINSQAQDGATSDQGVTSAK